MGSKQQSVHSINGKGIGVFHKKARAERTNHNRETPAPCDLGERNSGSPENKTEAFGSGRRRPHESILSARASKMRIMREWLSHPGTRLPLSSCRQSLDCSRSTFFLTARSATPERPYPDARTWLASARNIAGTTRRPPSD